MLPALFLEHFITMGGLTAQNFSKATGKRIPGAWSRQHCRYFAANLQV